MKFSFLFVYSKQWVYIKKIEKFMFTFSISTFRLQKRWRERQPKHHEFERKTGKGFRLN